MPAANYDIVIEQGATFNLSIIWKDADGNGIDISDCTARMQIRKSYPSNEVVLSLTDTDGIFIGSVFGSIDIEIPADVTETLDLRRGAYDLEIENSAGTVTRLLQGAAIISPEVTR